MSYLLKKLGYAIISLWAVTTLTFFLMKLLPGDPFTFEQGVSEQIQQTMRAHYGLNDSYFTQYFRYFTQLLKGNLGTSLLSGVTANAVIREAFPISAQIALQALVLAIPLGILFGTLAALKKEKWVDSTLLIVSVVALSIPSFILATLLQYTLAFKCSLFPIARCGTFMHTILPSVTLAVSPCVFLARLVRSSVVDVLQMDYVKTALAKGLPYRKVITLHVLRNALPALLPYLGQLSANILVGSFIVEKIFSIPGLGQRFVFSVSERDYGLITGLTLFYSFILVTLLLLFDLIYAWLDPRVQLRR